MFFKYSATHKMSQPVMIKAIRWSSFYLFPYKNAGLNLVHRLMSAACTLSYLISDTAKAMCRQSGEARGSFMSYHFPSWVGRDNSLLPSYDSSFFSHSNSTVACVGYCLFIGAVQRGWVACAGSWGPWLQCACAVACQGSAAFAATPAPGARARLGTTPTS